MQSRLNRTPQILRSYQLYLTDGNTAAFVATIAQGYSIGSLERLAESNDVVIRRAAALSIGLIGSSDSNTVLGRLLSDEDRKVRLVADDAMKAIWFRVGSPRIRQQMDRLSRLIQCDRYEQAILLADDLIAQGCEVPEAFSQRGLSRFYLEDARGGIEDCSKALDVNPYHYLAWIGIAHCHLELSEPLTALDAFRSALRIYPDIESVRIQIRRLERAFQEPR